MTTQTLTALRQLKLPGMAAALQSQLEQAGAYIAQRRLSLANYLKAWQGQREKVLGWFDPRLMQYPTSVAITWQTSFDQLEEPAQTLLQRLGWFGPEPIPESIIEVAVPGLDAAAAAPFEALAELCPE